MNLNKGISTPIAILIIVITAALVGGVFYWQYQNFKKVEAPEVINSKELFQFKKNRSRTKIDDWNTYTNKEYGFKIKYPQDWHTHSSDYASDYAYSFSYSTIVFSNLSEEKLESKEGTEGVKLLQVRVVELDKATWLEKHKQRAEELGEEITREKIELEGKQAYEMIGTNTKESRKLLSTVLFENNKTYIIEALFPEECRTKRCEFSNQMLSSFEFIKQQNQPETIKDCKDIKSEDEKEECYMKLARDQDLEGLCQTQCPNNFLKDLNKILPSSTYLTSISYQEKQEEEYQAQVSLTGFSPSREVLLELKSGIIAKSEWMEVEIPASSWVESVDIEFKVSFKVGPGAN